MDGDPPRPELPTNWTPEPLPEPVSMPAQLIEAWLRLDRSDRVIVELRRGDFDRFFATINKGLMAQSSLQETLIAYSKGELDAANRHLRQAQRSAIESENSLRQLMTAIMAAAVTDTTGPDGRG